MVPTHQKPTTKASMRKACKLAGDQLDDMEQRSRSGRHPPNLVIESKPNQKTHIHQKPNSRNPTSEQRSSRNPNTRTEPNQGFSQPKWSNGSTSPRTDPFRENPGPENTTFVLNIKSEKPACLNSSTVETYGLKRATCTPEKVGKTNLLPHKTNWNSHRTASLSITRKETKERS